MTDSGRSYIEAIEKLEAARRTLDDAIGEAWGLLPGQWGWYVTAKARDSILRLAQQMEAVEREHSGENLPGGPETTSQ